MTNWHLCAVKIGCNQSLTPWMHIYIHSDGSGYFSVG